MEGGRRSFTTGTEAEYFFKVVRKQKNYLLWCSLPPKTLPSLTVQMGGCRLADWDSQSLKILLIFINPPTSLDQPWMQMGTTLKSDSILGKELLSPWPLVSPWERAGSTEEQWFSNVVLRPAASASPRNLWEVQILVLLPPPRPNESETLGWEPEKCVWRSTAGDSDTW